MEENTFKTPQSALTEKINTYTDHPAYQEPLERSALHNNFRTIAGWLVIIIFFIALISTTINALYFSYELIASLVSGFDSKYIFIKLMTKTLMFYVSIWIAIRFMQWGRHLTRPTSREWV